ncbi:hypothetical protein [Halomonas sp. H5]|uniref:hypothetical protein n=1 Tax=Halomonas sp. H5 TaxID=3423910 RepID=UPI003D36394C
MSPEDTMRRAASRSPNGCSKQVMTQITPDERLKLEEIAELEMRSLSATVRMLMLRGIAQYEAETHAADDTP